MRLLTLCLLMLVMAAGAKPARAQEPEDGLEARTVQVGALERHYLEHKPDTVAPGAPVVILLHGGGGSMTKLFERRRRPTRQWLELSRREGFLLLAPNGTSNQTGAPTGDRQAWNDLRPDKRRDAAEVDDVAFIAALIDEAARRHGIDRTRIYVTGASNGGMMTYRLLIERPDLFAAGVAFIATLPESTVPEPPRPTPIMIVNGTKDPLVLYEGGPVARNRGQMRSSDATVAYWVAANRAGPGESVSLPDRNAEDGCRLIETRYPATEGGAEVLFIKMEGGGHVMPSTQMTRLGPLASRILGPPCAEADGAELAWAFMRRHRR